MEYLNNPFRRFSSSRSSGRVAKRASSVATCENVASAASRTAVSSYGRGRQWELLIEEGGDKKTSQLA